MINLFIDDKKLVKILNNISSGVYALDNRRNILFWNKKAEDITGFNSDEVIGKSCKDNILEHINKAGRNLCLHGCPVSSTLADGRERETQVFLHHKEGHRIPVSVKVFPVYDDDNMIEGAIEIFDDLREKEKFLEEIKKYKEMAYMDSVTGIPNKKYLEDNLTRIINESQKFNYGTGILLIEVQNIPKINDEHGIETGDRVIKMIAMNLHANTRNSDLTGRLEGNKFLSIVRFVEKDQLKIIAEKYINTANACFIMKDDKKISTEIKIIGTLIRENDDNQTVKKRLFENRKNATDTFRII
ncbi:GGDEF domain-containing protein [Geotoga petraea]|uniref:GGDEF domain-containing protein n=1 Tax=Geotoga petraea TaxID=28234 RepID=A0A4Z0VX56_9BACT|nr:GGDEF domain-containing protein [Geotoga petraea]